MPSAFVATETGFKALPRRKQMAVVAASVVAVTMMAAVAFGGNALPDPGYILAVYFRFLNRLTCRLTATLLHLREEPDSDIAPVTGLDTTVASVLRLRCAKHWVESVSKV